MTEAPSFMARFGARLVANGYSIVPIQPGTKKPGCHRDGQWRDYAGWNRHATRGATALELEEWSRWPESGIGIVAGSVAGVDIDIADDAELSRLTRQGSNPPQKSEAMPLFSQSP